MNCRLLLLAATVELRYSSLVCAHIVIMDSLRPPNHISFLLKFIAIIGLISALFYWTGVNLRGARVAEVRPLSSRYCRVVCLFHHATQGEVSPV